ncbi:MAG: hypothetical protein PVH29_09970 [Candidatus Zixiibacteriota bacterium]|jgi:hypothetical protein
MVSRTNVNDVTFLKDWVKATDYRRDVNAAAEAARDAMLDIFGMPAVILSGLEVEDGSTSDTFHITAGRARDMKKYHVVVAAAEDEVAAVDAGGGYNYVAIRSIWAYGGPDGAHDTGLGYNRQRVDDYEIAVAGSIFDERGGWINLARAKKTAGVWAYDIQYPYRSHEATADVAQWTFTRPGLYNPELDIAYFLHHGLAYDIFPTPFDIRFHRLTVTADSPGADDIEVALVIGGDATDLKATLPAGEIGPVSFFKREGVEAEADDLIQVTPLSGKGAYKDLSVVVAGYRTAELGP